MTFNERLNKALRKWALAAPELERATEEYFGGVPGFEEESESEVRKQREPWTDEDWQAHAVASPDMGQFGEDWVQHQRAMRKDGA